MASYSRWFVLGLVTVLSLGVTQTVWAHAGHLGPHGSPAIDGALHPWLGIDHLLAMLASGLLAVRMTDRRALWLIPVSFVGLMLVGGGLAAGNVPFFDPEWGIALSVIVLGLIVARVRSLPLSVGVTLVGLFALCHGHAHIAEFSGQMLWLYLIGMSASTLALHGAAIGFGLAAHRLDKTQWVRYAGAGIACGFAFMLLLA